ncbi:helix-turn-helix domain-containing protein [Phyllobacterium zundukense]|uniref:AraC family transcriptional regulator n=1 Tax=Phyllobacterium zundukense TaxID=1867719 RepID=A0A2N9VYH0_9HYPH|nr:helix-turn-helix domain-containing protein [Phyllobacterium zundukense]ATU95126.1 AraC family transcriptional regulator [Phyllobacterium zundukense]PIO44538.1 AraC family transcriptional regulator [Phyllobacterium zundukense]
MQSLMTPGHRPVPVEILEAEIRRVCGSFNLEPMRRTGVVDGDVTTRRVGPFDTAVVALDASEVVRSTRSIRQDPGEYFFLLVQDAGQCRVEQGDHVAELSPGDMFLVDSVKPSTFLYRGERSNQVSLHIPRDEMMHRFGAACTGGLSISRNDPLWLAMRAVIAKMLLEEGAQAQLAEAFLCLIGAYLHSSRATGMAAPAETLLSRALAMIDRYRADPTFGPRELAFRLNVSERMLQRHFRPLGETPSHRLINRRLELAHARLSARKGDQPSEGVTAVAFDCGFNDLSYFYREFRKKYGATPGTVARCH